jgi:O-methyltransferase
MLAKAAPERSVYGFDTFEGLPAVMWSEGEPHAVGDFADTSFEAVRAALADCPNVALVQGLFPISAVGLFPNKFAFVHLDFDFYESTRRALDWLIPRMSPGGVIVFDDYEWHRCPGVKRAIDEFGLAVERSATHQAVWVA